MWLYTLTPISFLYTILASFSAVKPIPADQLSMELHSFLWMRPAEHIIVDWMFCLLSKLPIILADLGIGIILYEVIHHITLDTRKSHLGLASWYLNPFIIWVSSCWGMFDSLPTFFVLLSLISLKKRRFLLSGVSLALSLGYKTFGIVLLFPVLLALKSPLGNSRKNLFRFLLGLVLVSFLISLPFLSKYNFKTYITTLTREAPGSPPTMIPSSFGGISYLSFLWFLGPSLENFHSNLLLLLYIISFIAFGYLYWKFRAVNLLDNFNFFIVFMTCFFTYYITAPRVWEHHAIWCMPLIIIMTYCFDFNKKVMHLIWIVPLLFNLINTGPFLYFLPLLSFQLPINNSLTSAIVGYYNFESLHLPLKTLVVFVLGVLFSLLSVYTLLYSHKKLYGRYLPRFFSRKNCGES